MIEITTVDRTSASRRSSARRLSRVVLTAVACIGLGASADAGQSSEFLAGAQDDFALPQDPASPDAELLAFLQGTGNPVAAFDQAGAFGHTFDNLPDNVVSATLEVHLSVVGGNSPNDLLYFERLDDPGIWCSPIADLPEAGGTWTTGQSATITFDLANLPDYQGRTSVIDRINADNALDVYIQDDTAVDYMLLTVTTDGPYGGPTSSWGLDRLDQRSLPLDGMYVPCGSGAGAHIYVVSTGINPTHVDFEGRADIFYESPSIPSTGGVDCSGFGTHVASLAAGATYGAAKQASVHGVRVLNCAGAGSEQSIEDGIDAIIAGGSMPGVVAFTALATGAPSVDLAAKIQELIDAGYTVVAPAGNLGTDLCGVSSTWPSLVPDVIWVGATAQDDCRAPFSDYGCGIDLFAPGVDITAAWYTSNTATKTISGMQMATGYVAGVAAEYLAAGIASTPAEVEAALLARRSLAGCAASLPLLYAGFDLGPDQATWTDPYEPGTATEDCGAAQAVPSVTVGSGVQAFSGAYTQSTMDLSLPAISAGVNFQRTLRTNVATHSTTGNWDSSYTSRLEWNLDGDIVFVKDNGRRDIYTQSGPDTFTSAEFFEVITLEEDGSATVTYADTSTRRFAAPTSPLAGSAPTSCPTDLDGSGDTGFSDLTALLAAWGACPGCPADFDGNGDVGFADLTALLAAWGPCPITAGPGAVLGFADRNGNALDFVYDDQGRLTQIIDDLGRPTDLAYDADGLIETVTDFAGREVRYAYYQDGDADGSGGDLKSVTTPAVVGTSSGNDYPQGKTTTYTYTKGFADDRLNHMLVSTTDPKGQTYLTNVYAHTIDAGDFRHTEDPNDFYFGRVVRQIPGDPGDIIDFVYVPVTPSVANGQAVNKTIVNDRVGNVTEHFYDAGNRKVMERRYTGRATNPDNPTTDSGNRPANPLRGDDPAYYETRWEYNADALVTRIVHPNGSEETFVYDETNPSRRSQGNLLEHCAIAGVLGGDQAQRCETFEYDDELGAGCCGTNFVTRNVDARGNETLHEYDAVGNRTHTQHRIPSIVEDYEYNARGQMTAHVQPDNGSGNRRRDEYAYYDSGPQAGYLQASIVDAGGFALTTTYEYDAVGNLNRTVDPRGNDTQYEVNALNQVVRELSRPVDGGGTRYEKLFWYDGNNNLVRTDVENRDAAGAVEANSHFTSINEYDILNHVVRTTRESGSYTGSIPGTTNEPTGVGLPDAEFITTEYVYDANRNRTLLRSGESVNGNQPTNVVRTLYDERDLVYQTIRAEGDVDQSTTQHDYDGNGNVVRTETGLEGTPRVSLHVCDGYDRRLSTTDPMGNVTERAYDANSNVVTMRSFGELDDVSGDTGNVRLSEASLVYDAMDRVIRQEVAHFDPATQGVFGDGLAATETEYSDASQVTLVRNDNGHVTVTVYDNANRVALVTDAKGNTISRSYDANSNVVTITETEKSDLGNPDELFTTTMAYDGLDRPISTTDNVGNVNQVAYDSRGNRMVSIDAIGNVVRHAYDGVNRRTSTTRELTDSGDGAGTLVDTIVTTQTWDDNSRLIGRGDDNGNFTTQAFDALNRQVAEVYADATSKTFAYDVHHNVTTKADANGTTVTSTYDMNDRLVAKTVTPGAGVSSDTTFEQFAYDGLSRLVTASDDDSTVLHTYDSMSNVVSETLNGQVTACVFDGVGNMVQCTYPGSRTITRTFDDLERAKVITDAAGMIAAYDYDGPSRVTLRNYGNGTRSGYIYDGITGIPNPTNDFGVKQIVRTSHQRISDGFVLEDRTFTWDRVGNKTQRLDLAGLGDVYDYEYDSAYRMVRSMKTPPGGTGGELSYQLDGVGNRQTVTGRTDPGSYTLDASLPPADFQMNQYTATPTDARQYDDNGNLVAFGGTATATYDYRNQMVGYDDVPNGVQATYAYDVLGRRIERAVGGQATRYFYDGRQVVEEQDGFGVTEATYVYGLYVDEVLNMQRGGVDYYYHTDDLYNVMAVTNGTGAVVERYEYDDYGQVEFRGAFGSPIAASAIGNAYGFTGRRLDSESGLYHYRTRYMDPAVGRFTTRDTIGVWGDPANLGNGYAYVGNNAWSKVDPSGRAPGDPLDGIDVSIIDKGTGNPVYAHALSGIGVSIIDKGTGNPVYAHALSGIGVSIIDKGTGNPVDSRRRFDSYGIVGIEILTGSGQYTSAVNSMVSSSVVGIDILVGSGQYTSGVDISRKKEIEEEQLFWSGAATTAAALAPTSVTCSQGNVGTPGEASTSGGTMFDVMNEVTNTTNEVEDEQLKVFSEVTNTNNEIEEEQL